MTDFKRRYVMITRMFYGDMCMLGQCYLKLVNLVIVVIPSAYLGIVRKKAGSKI